MSEGPGTRPAMPASVDAMAIERLRRTRLERLRDAHVRDAAELRRPAIPDPRPDRAATLARDVGGSVVGTAARPIVVVESRTPIRAGLDGLRDLPQPVDPQRPFVLFDTETTGLGSGTGTVPFLIGIGTWERDAFVTRQLLLPDQSDEPAFLELLASWIPDDACLVSYNGRTFDWPLLVTRFRLHGRRPPAFGEHLDLLPLARLLWKHRLPDARLASVEAGVCGVRRPHDLPGALVPGRYLDYLRSGHGSLLRDVLEHNRQDVVSMALLLRVLADDLAPVGQTGHAPPWVHPGDVGGLGRAYARARRHAQALACFEAAMERIVDAREAQRYESIAVERARALTRMGRREEAHGAWHALALEGGRHAALAWLHVAKHHEHDQRDYRAALAASDRARSISERRRLFGQRDRRVERDLARRVPRLRRRLAAGRS